MKNFLENIDLEKLIEDAKKFSKKAFGSEAVRIGAAVFFGLIFLIVLVPFLFNNSALKFQIEQKISQVYGVNMVIHGDVSVAFLPSPTITIKDALLQNYKPQAGDLLDSEKKYNLYAKLVKIKLPIFKLANDAFARKIIFEDVELESYYEINEKTPRQNKVTEIAAEFAQNPAPVGKKLDSGISAQLFSIDDVDASHFKTINLPDLIIKNGEVFFYDKLSRKQEVKAINANASIGKNKIFAVGTFNSESIISNFKLLVKFNSRASSNNSLLEVISPVVELRIRGSFTSENHGILGSDFNGKVEAEIFDLQTFYKSYISDVSVLANKLKHGNKSIKIGADIDGKSGEISIKNIQINSSLLNGKGDIYLNLSDKIPLIDINFDLDNLDLDNIWSGEVVQVADEQSVDNKIPVAVDEVVEVLPKAGVAPAVEDDKKTSAGNAKKMQDKTIIIDGKTLDPTVPIQQLHIAKSLSDVVMEIPKPAAPEEKVIPEKVEPKKEESKKIEPFDLDLASRIKNFDLTAEIKIKSVKYLEGEIKDVDLYTTISRDGEIMVLPLIFRIPGEGIFRVNGVLDNSAALPKFVGKFDASGKVLSEVLKWLKIESQNLKFDKLKEYIIYSDVLLLPNTIVLNNFYLNLNSLQSEFLGEVRIDNSSKVPNITNRFRITNFNVDDYFRTSGENVYLAPGLLIKKLLWLNDIPSNTDLDLNFDKLVYKNETFLNQALKMRFGRGYFEVRNLALKSDRTNLKADLTVDLSDKNPRFNLKIAADSFSYITPVKAKEEGVEAAKSAVVDFFVKDKNKNFTDQFFALPSLEGFSGKIALQFDSLKLDDLKIKKVNLVGNLQDGSIDVSQFYSEIYGGTFVYKGVLSIKDNKIINGNLNLNGVYLQPILSDLFGIKNVSGIANISANITAAANSKTDFLKSFSSETKISVNAPTVEQYGLNDLVQKMFMAQNYRNELLEPEKILLNPANTTIFKQATGVIKVNGGKGGKMRINITSTAVNGILSGKIDPATNTIDALFNVIFLTGTRQKQTPINIATGLKGDMSNLSQSTNIDQARQYLGLPVNKPAPIPSDPIKSDDMSSGPVNQGQSQSMQNNSLPTQGLSASQKSQLLPAQQQFLQVDKPRQDIQP